MNKRVEEVLNESDKPIGFEELEQESNSPLNQPVLEKEIGGGRNTNYTLVLGS